MAVKKGADYERKIKPSEKKAIAKAQAHPEYQPAPSVPVEQLPDYKEVLEEYCREYREITEQAKVLEERRKQLAEVLIELARDIGEPAIVGSNWRMSYVKSSRRSLSETRLVELGVDPDTIDQARTETPYDYVQVLKYDPTGE